MKLLVLFYKLESSDKYYDFPPWSTSAIKKEKHSLHHTFSLLFRCCRVQLPGNPVDCSTPGFPVLHCLLEFAQIDVHLSLLKFMSIESLMPSKYLILCHPLLLLPSIFPSIRVFPVSQLFTSHSQNTGVSASALVLLINIQG